MYAIVRSFHGIKSLRPLFAVAWVCALLGSSAFCFAQAAAAHDENSQIVSAPDGAQPAAKASTIQAAAPKAIPHVPHPPIHIIRMGEPGGTPVKTTSIPHVIYFGGPVISNVHIVEVLYGTGAFQPNVAGTATPTLGQFYTDITQSSLFDMLSEYSTVGVTAADGTAGTNQTIGHGFFDGLFTITPAPVNNGSIITDGQIQSELLAQVSAGQLPAPVFDAQGNNDTLYMIFFPPGKTITAGGATSCVNGGFCAYHNSTSGTFASHRLYYGVHPDIQPPSGCSGGCGGSANIFDNITNVTSHELSEAVTDADVGPATTFARPLAWIDPVNSEIGDICVAQEAPVVANGTTYIVQREFSNVQDDCVASPPSFRFPGGQTLNPGQQFSIPVTIQSDRGLPLLTYTGTVHFSSTDPKAVLPPDYTFSFADAGSHNFVVSLDTPGTQSITAVDTKSPLMTGSASYTVSASTAASFTVAIPGNAVAGTAIPVFVTARTAQSSDVATGYTGTIHFRTADSTAVLPANATLVNGTGSFSVTFNSTGLQSLVVEDVATPQIFGSANSNVAAAPASPSSISVGVTPSPGTFGQSSTYTATVTQGGVPVASGIVNFTSDGQSMGSSTLDVNGHAQVTQFLNGGQHIVFADYLGDGTTVPPSSSAPLTSVIDPAPTTITVSTTGTPSIFGDSLIFTAQITSPVSGINGGTVTFTDGGSPLAIFSSVFNSVVFRDNSLPVGSHSIVASYSGTANFAASTSAPLVQVVNPAPAANYSLTADKNSATLLAGQSATFVITTNEVSGFNGTVKFSCGTLPTLTTCTFTPATVTVNAFNSPVTSTLTIKTTGPHAALIYPLKRNPGNALWWIANPFAFGVFLLGGRRRRRRATFLAAVLGLVLVVGFSGCGSHSAPPPPPPVTTTPAGTSTVTVTAAGISTSGPNAANPTQQLNINLTVQP